MEENKDRSEPVRRFASLVRKARERREFSQAVVAQLLKVCLLYTSDAADE